MKKLIFVISFIVLSGLFFEFTTPDAKAATIAELQAQIQQLTAQIATLQQQLSQLQPAPITWCHTFNVNLKIGDRGSEVTALQTALAKEGATAWEYKGYDGVFDEMTASEVVGFQEKYASEVLAPWGLEYGTGYVGPTTQAKLNELYGCKVIEKIKFLAPKSGDRWIIGETHTIRLNKGTPYESHCSNNFSLIDKHGKSVGVIGIIDKGESTFNWDTKTLYSFACGTGAEVITVNPGEYKIRLEEHDTRNGVGPDIVVYSDYFSIVAKETCHTSPLWSWDYCSPTCQCNAGEGDCDTDADCTTGYCAHNVGAKYGQVSSMDVCEEECRDEDYECTIEDKPCCEGLKEVGLCFEEGDGCICANCGSICRPCGNGICDSNENKCNCPEDCAAEEEEISCSDSDGGKNYYTKGTVSRCGSGGMAGIADICEIATDECTYCTGTCLELPCEVTCGAVKEYYCEGTEIKSETHVCPTGYTCKGSACTKVEKSITVTSPNGGEKWVIGGTYNIKWDAKGFEKVVINVTDYSCSSEVAKTIATGIAAAQGSYSWTIPSDFFESTAGLYCPATPPAHYNGWKSGDNFKIFVAELKSNGTYGVQDKSDNYFSIVEHPVVCTDLYDGTKARMGAVCGDQNYNYIYDVNKDKIIDVTDYSTVLAKIDNETWCNSIKESTLDPCTTTYPSSCVELYQGVINRFGTQCGDTDYYYMNDINKDKVIDATDYSTVITNIRDESWCNTVRASAENPCQVGLKTIENQLASIAEAISQLVEKVLIGR